MAEEQMKGALASIEPTEAAVSTAADPVTSATDKYMQEKAALIKQRQDLLDSLEVRARPNATDFLMSLSKGFLAPTRSGSFGESLGNVVGEVGQYRGEQQKRETDLAKMRMEMGVQQLGLTKEDIELAKKQQLSTSLKQLFTGNGGQDVSIPGVSSALIDGLDPQTRKLLAAQAISDPEGAIKKLIEMGVERAKIPDAIKSLQFHISQFPPNMRPQLQQWASRAALVDPEKYAALMERVAKAIKSGDMTHEAGERILAENSPPSFQAPPVSPAPVSGSVSATPSAAPGISPAAQPTDNAPRGAFKGKFADIIKGIMGIEDEKIQNEALQAILSQVVSEGQLTLTGQPATRPSVQPEAPPASQAPAPSRGLRLPTREQMSRPSPAQLAEVETAGLKATKEQDVKDITDFRKSLSENFRTARERMSDANTLVSLTQKSPNIFGYFNKPTVANAVTQLIQGGGTILGLNVKVPEFKEALIKLGATQDEINTLSQADFISIKQQLALGQQMKGAVSNFERELVARAVATANDNPNVVRWKSNIQKARALADREIWELYQETPNISETKFTSLPEYKEIINRLDARLKSNNSAYSL